MLPLLPLLLGACTPTIEAPEEERLATVSHQVNWESVTRLGPHRMELSATLDRASGSRTEGFSVLWGSWDDFEVTRSRDGRTTQDLRIISGVAWTSNDGHSFNPQRDAEIYRAELSTTWNDWDRHLEPFLGGLVLESDREAVVEGRPAERYLISLDPEWKPAGRRADVPTSLSGHVTLDSATGVRLLGQVEGHYLERGETDKPATLTVNLLRTEIGTVPTIPIPEETEDRPPRRKKGKKKED